jgi:hypothetical protein
VGIGQKRVKILLKLYKLLESGGWGDCFITKAVMVALFRNGPLLADAVEKLLASWRLS